MIKLLKAAGGVVLTVAVVILVLLFCSSLQRYLDDAMGALDYVFTASQCVVIAFIGGMFLGD
jgi:hypothetical protein